MKIKLLVRPCSPGLAARIAGDGELGRKLGARANAAVGFLFPKAFDAQGPLLGRLLALAQDEALSFLRDVEWRDDELDGASHLEVIARVTSGQTRAEAMHTLAAFKATPLQATHGRWSVRRPTTLFVSRALPGHTIAHVDQWTGEFVVGAAVAAGLRQSGLTGFELRPVQQLRKPVREDAFHLVSSATLPEAQFDATGWVDPDGTPRRYGALAYAPGALSGSADFARTAEPWCAWQVPAWVVTQAVRRLYADSGWRGWGFRPLLVSGSAAHEEHLERWRSVLARLAAHGRASVMA